MENLEIKELVKSSFWKNKKILITGHTGFKGSWLSLWLHLYGAKIFGISLPPKEKNGLYDLCKINKIIEKDIILDIRNKKKFENEIKKFKPKIVFHLAAQPLVIQSYLDPIETIETNIIGTANLLDLCRKIKTLKTIVIVTTDKVYKNQNKKILFKENHELGGDDIYSYSKVSVEMLVNSYRKSFYENKIKIVTVRAGNVIGGGDWAKDRLIPDFIKSIIKNKKFVMRNPKHIRPWQHVLECLYGYILLVEKIYNKKNYHDYEAINFGPDKNKFSNVEKVVSKIYKKFNISKKPKIKKKYPKYFEKILLELNSNKAKKLLKWKTVLSLNESINLTLDWYINFINKRNVYEYTCKQIQNYVSKFK